MKNSTKERIVRNSYYGLITYIGKYSYKIQWHPLANKDYIVRCPRGKEEQEFLIQNFEKGIPEILNYWEFLEPLDLK